MSRSTAYIHHPSKAYLCSKGLPMDSKDDTNDEVQEVQQIPATASHSAVSLMSTAGDLQLINTLNPASNLIPESASVTPTSTTEVQESKNRRSAFDKQYNTSNNDDDEILGQDPLRLPSVAHLQFHSQTDEDLDVCGL
jgi:hypothetical protein